jgi:hypothetical protein
MFCLARDDIARTAGTRWKRSDDLDFNHLLVGILRQRVQLSLTVSHRVICVHDFPLQLKKNMFKPARIA